MHRLAPRRTPNPIAETSLMQPPRAIAAALSVVLLVSTATACSTTAPRVATQVSTTQRTVLLLGDSLSSAHRLPEGAGWVTLLQKRLASGSALPPTIINVSRGGKMVADAIAEAPALLAEHAPETVIIELGGNDAIMGADAEAIERDLTVLVDMAQAADARVVILGFDIPAAFDKNGSAAMLRGVYQRVAAAQGVTLLPSLLAGISNDPNRLLDDGIHPNADAQAAVLDNAWGTLRPALLD